MNISDFDWQQILTLANNSNGIELCSLITDLDEKYKSESIKNRPKRSGNSIPPDGNFLRIIKIYFDKFQDQVELNHLEEWISDYYLSSNDTIDFEKIQENINWLCDVECLALDEDDYDLIWFYEDNFGKYYNTFCKRCYREMKTRKYHSGKSGGEEIEECYCYSCENADLTRLARTAGK